MDATLGGTLRLCWQGAWGTSLVFANAWALALAFPHGGKCKPGQVAPVDEETLWAPACLEYVDENWEHCGSHIAMFDYLFVMFLLYFLRFEKNTMMFATSWHACFMFEFMSYGGWQGSWVVVITTLLGVGIASLSISVPWKWRDSEIL